MSEVGPQPDPTAETGEPLPGGADSLADEEKYGTTADEPVVPDLDPAKNPAVDDVTPDEITEGDDKQQEPDEDAPEEPSSEPAD